MDHSKNTILFTVHYAGEIYPIQTAPNQYYSLMTLIADELAIPGFGLCCGMGSCGTCMVQVVDPCTKLKRTVLACDIRVNDELANMEVIITENCY